MLVLAPTVRALEASGALCCYTNHACTCLPLLCCLLFLQPGVFGMSAQDQQAQLRQLLSQAQQRVPGMP
jgi:hypothetical protein